MAPRSKLDLLPEDLLELLDERLAKSHFHDIDEHHAWLVDEIDRRGLELQQPISRSAVGRYSRMRKLQGQSIEESVRQMRQIQMEFGDDPTAFLVNGTNMAQMLAWKRVQAAMSGDVDVDEDFLKGISLAMSRMAKTAVINDERERTIRDEAATKAKAEAAQVIDDNAHAQGMTEEQARFWREKILGIV